MLISVRQRPHLGELRIKDITKYLSRVMTACIVTVFIIYGETVSHALNNVNSLHIDHAFKNQDE